MKKIGMGFIGPGFVAAHHLDAVRRLGDVDIVAIAGSSQQSADKKAQAYKVDRVYGNYKALIADPDVQVIDNTPPNHLYRRLRDTAVAAKVAHVVTFNYRGNPLVQQTVGMFGYDGVLSIEHEDSLLSPEETLTRPHIF
jgi:predicted dehydrogenase